MPSFDRPGFDSNTDSKVPAITVESWQEMEMRLQYMQTQVDEAQAALARKHIQQLELSCGKGRVRFVGEPAKAVQC